MSFNGLGDTFAYNVASKSKRNFQNSVESLARFHERIKNAVIENDDALNVIERMDRESTLFYIDPPYVLEMRKNKKDRYLHEQPNSHHENLVELLCRIKGKAIVSCYDHEIYRTLLSFGWEKRDFLTNVCVRKDAMRERKKVVETIYISPRLAKELEGKLFFFQI